MKEGGNAEKISILPGGFFWPIDNGGLMDDPSYLDKLQTCKTATKRHVPLSAMLGLFAVVGWVDKPSICGKLLGFRYRSNPAYELENFS